MPVNRPAKAWALLRDPAGDADIQGEARAGHLHDGRIHRHCVVQHSGCADDAVIAGHAGFDAVARTQVNDERHDAGRRDGERADRLLGAVNDMGQRQFDWGQFGPESRIILLTECAQERVVGPLGGHGVVLPEDSRATQQICLGGRGLNGRSIFCADLNAAWHVCAGRSGSGPDVSTAAALARQRPINVKADMHGISSPGGLAFCWQCHIRRGALLCPPGATAVCSCSTR